MLTNNLISGYNIYRSDNWGNLKILDRIEGQALQYTDKSIQDGNIYQYAVTATFQELESSQSDIIMVDFQ